MARLLPGVYSAINDLSQFPEGAQTLNVGYVVQANRGPVNEWSLCTNPTDFLTKYTFSGKVDLNADPTMHEIIKVMAQTNTMYVTRAANNPLYGGAFVKAPQKHGAVLAADQATETFLIKVNKDKDAKEEAPKAGDSITVSGTGLFDGYFIVDKVEAIADEYEEYDEETEKTIKYNLFEVVVGDENRDTISFKVDTLEIDSADATNNTFTIKGDYSEEIFKGDIITVSGSTSNNGYYKISRTYLNEIQDPEDPSEVTYTTTLYIDVTADSDVFKTSVEADTSTDKGGILVNSFSGTSVFKTPIVGLSTSIVADVRRINADAIEVDGEPTGGVYKLIYLRGKADNKVSVGDKVRIKGCPTYTVIEDDKEKEINNNNVYTVVKATYDIETNLTEVKVKEKLAGSLNPSDFDKLVSITEAPTEPKVGDLYFDKTEGRIKEYIESSGSGEWVNKDVASETFFTYNEDFYQFIIEGTEGVLNLVGSSLGHIYFESIVNPEAILNSMDEDTLFFITGTDPGAYNGEEAFSIVSAFDNKDQLVYYKGAEGLFSEPCTFDTMQLNVYNANTNEQLESFTFSRDPEAKAIDGSSLFVDDVVAGSAYIKVFNNTASTDVPSSTLAGSPLQASGGYDGETVTAADMVRALSAFEDKTIPISLLGNGCSTQAESATFQQALIQLAVTRKDCFVFLNSKASDEKFTLPSARAQAIVDYKKGTLASTSFYGCMYAPHVNTPDVFNSRDVKIGADAVAIAGWLNVINSLNYPYAYAGPRNGLVQGVTCDWKIGDMSGEAEMLNDASVNYVAYDGKVGRYYMQCQNTLQIANSAMRNIGVVLNVLDIKENLVNYLKEFINLPITDSLRRDIMDTCNDFLAPMTGVRFYDYVFQDVTTEADIAQDTLRYLLTLSPTRYAQRIYLVMNIVRTGFDFSILQSV